MTVRITVNAKPRAKKSGIVRTEGLTIDVALAAPPVDGAANEELVAVVAKALGVAKRSVRLVMGERSKRKVLEVTGLNEDEVIANLGRPRDR